jgi:hypothetical protein
MVLLKLFVKCSNFLLRLSGRKICDEGDNIIVGGMPRSANVVLSRLLRSLGINVVRQHFHSPGAIAAFPRYIFIYRRPSGVIPSLMVYFNLSFFSATIYYLSFFLRISLIRPVTFIDFEQLFKHQPTEIYLAVCQFYAFPTHIPKILTWEDIVNDIDFTETEQGVAVARSSVPRQEKSERLVKSSAKHQRWLRYLDKSADWWMRRRGVSILGGW